MIYLRLVLAALFWGGTFVAGRLLAGDLDPYVAGFLRFFIASVILLPLMLREASRFPRLDTRQWFGVTLLGITGVFTYNVLFFSALQSVEAGRSAVIVASNPVFIALFAFLLFKESFSLQRVIGILLSVLGALVVISRGDPGFFGSGGVGVGELYLLGALVSWVAYTLIGKHLLSGLTPLVAVTGSAIIGTALLFLPAYQRGLVDSVIGLGIESLLALGYLALFGTVLAFVWFYRGIKEIGAARASVFINLVPVSGVCLGILLLDETLSGSLFFGGLLVILGVMLTNRQLEVVQRLRRFG